MALYHIYIICTGQTAQCSWSRRQIASDVATVEEHTVHFQLIAQGAAEKGPQGGPETRRVVSHDEVAGRFSSHDREMDHNAIICNT